MLVIYTQNYWNTILLLEILTSTTEQVTCYVKQWPTANKFAPALNTTTQAAQPITTALSDILTPITFSKNENSYQSYECQLVINRKSVLVNVSQRKVTLVSTCIQVWLSQAWMCYHRPVCISCSAARCLPLISNSLHLQMTRKIVLNFLGMKHLDLHTHSDEPFPFTIHIPSTGLVSLSSISLVFLPSSDPYI
jgi:hypothetical protein